MHGLAARTRRELLADLRELAPVIAVLGGAGVVAGTLSAIQNVGRWWPQVEWIGRETAKGKSQMAKMTDYADLEIGLHRRDADSYGVELRFSQPKSDAEVRLVREGASDDQSLLQPSPSHLPRETGCGINSLPDLKVVDFPSTTALSPSGTTCGGGGGVPGSVLDSVVIDVLKQGGGQLCQVRCGPPDGSTPGVIPYPDTLFAHLDELGPEAVSAIRPNADTSFSILCSAGL